nr:immunoglobulin light chain junction region [Macaca mulatta]MOX77631.1 immunoglobulin light chain junction region [Macaca mulatta]MOX78948.1 immunoglobulin light chain junction region [Macaca mulatta]MOX80662.1 immunoglobulin light chain junction region [Macaca mulatta]MOX81453.1 immunoglobulin light chain junction region [Macaca mulatta]
DYYCSSYAGSNTNWLF